MEFAIGEMIAGVGVFLTLVMALVAMWLNHVVKAQGESMKQQAESLSRDIDKQGDTLSESMKQQAESTERVLMAHVEADRKRTDRLEANITAQGTTLQSVLASVGRIEGLLSPKPWEPTPTPEADRPGADKPT